MNLEELKAAVIADGKIDATEVAQIREVVFADGVIDKAEADMLFEMNDACSEADNAPEWEALFVEAIASYVLHDEVSPGAIDAEEGEYLYDKIAGDGGLDDTEQALLKHIRTNATSIDSPKLMELYTIMDSHNENATDATPVAEETPSTEG